MTESARDVDQGESASATRFSGRALDYFAAHAIDPQLAAQVGVAERSGALVYPCVDGEGPFERTRPLGGDSKRTIQPAGRALVCWWPRGRPARAASVLVCEGEPDALAALSAIATADELPAGPRDLLRDFAVVAVPGTGFKAERLIAELKRVGARDVVLAPDSDVAGEKFAARLDEALRATDLQVITRLSLPQGEDLADRLADERDGASWLAGAIADAKAQAQEHSTRSRPPADELPGAGAAPWPSLPGTRPEFPLEALPSDIRGFVEAVAEETQTPADLAALAALGVLSAAALGPIEVDCRVWREESLGLYVLVAMPSGDHKSTVLKAAVAPLRAIERELQEHSAAPRRDLQRRREILLGRQTSLTKTAATHREAESRKTAEEELAEVDAELEEIGEPVAPRLLANDATAEALGGLLARHGRIAVIAAEAPLIDNLTGRYSDKGAANLHLVCGAYNGEPTQIDRRGREPEVLERPVMAMTFTVQPHVLDALVNHETARGQGFVGRFALVLPKSRLGARRTKVECASVAVHRAWEATVRRVSTANPLTDLTENPSGGNSVGSVSTSLSRDSGLLLLSLSYEACELLTQLRDELEPRLREDGDLFTVADWVARHPGRIARIAGLLHIAEGRPPDKEISAATIGSALQIGEYLLAHSLAALVVRDERMRRYLGWLAACETPTVTQRDLHRGPLSARGGADDARQLAERLVTLGALRPLPADLPRRGQPSSPAYEISPRLRGEGPVGGHEEWWQSLAAAGGTEFDFEQPSAEDLAALSANGNGSSR